MARLETVDEDGDQAGHSADASIASEDLSEATSEDDETSSSGSSSDEIDSDEDEGGTDGNEPPITTSASHVTDMATDPTALKSRLASFIPQLQRANAELATNPDAATKRIDDLDDEEEQYIEMNLGLGVLKGNPATKDAAGVKTGVSEDSESSDDTASASEDEVGAGNAQVGIFDKLKGIKPAKRKIEEVG